MKSNREKLSESLEKRGYKNEDLINEIEQIYSNQQLPIHGVVSSLKKICNEHNIDTEDVLLEYDKKQNGFDVLYDEGIEVAFFVRKGFIQL